MTLTRCEQAILTFLHRKRTWVDRDVLDAFTREASDKYDHAKPRKAGTMRVHIHNIRRKLGKDAILCMVQADGGRRCRNTIDSETLYTLGAPGVMAARALEKEAA